ncbi:unnamed protein product [Brachionus calyciflorus]|uniref:DUF268 domain-containing protein n=1 Tax=Brachionus calyciflorus TaxID=104777 RepID=A0A814L844_9BILA|nr:unnamed protein product [Brachionus calyciflorus]
MSKSNTFLGIGALICVFLIVFLNYKSKNQIIGPRILIGSSLYKQKCVDLYIKERSPDPKLIVRPPLKEMPKDMANEFTMNGKMPNTKNWYFNEVYSDSASESKKVNQEITLLEFAKNVEKARNKQAMPTYGDSVLNNLMEGYSSRVKDKSVIVIGTQSPWVEAIAYNHGAKFITTLDYTRKKYLITNMKWYHVNDFLDERIKSREIEDFDVAMSFSSIEHSGLGRYGDPLNPNGDIDAVQQMHCLLRPRGLLFLAIPASLDGSSYMEFNAQRVYGKVRLEALFKGWKLLNQTRDSLGIHGIYVLEKIETL